MTILTHRIAETRVVAWLERWRLVRWLWRWRWPGCPLTIALALALAQYWYQPDQHHWLDKGIVVLIVAAASLLLLALVVGTPRPWGPEATGILHFVLGDLALYGLIALPGIFDWEWSWWPDRLPWYFLRGNLAVAAPVLILAYSDYFAERWQARKGVRR